MKFDEILHEIEKLKGKHLESIGPAKGIQLISINKTSYVIQREDGKEASRSVPQELEVIWDALQKRPAVHVDSLLGGSGSSRNQPETIFANLPFIKHLKINNRKHLAFIPGEPREHGTLQKASPAEAGSIEHQMEHARLQELAWVVLSCASIQEAANLLDGDQLEIADQINGAHTTYLQCANEKTLYLLFRKEDCGLPEGQYPVTGKTREASPEEAVFPIAGVEYCLEEAGGIAVLARVTAGS